MSFSASCDAFLPVPKRSHCYGLLGALAAGGAAVGVGEDDLACLVDAAEFGGALVLLWAGCGEDGVEAKHANRQKGDKDNKEQHVDPDGSGHGTSPRGRGPESNRGEGKSGPGAGSACFAGTFHGERAIFPTWNSNNLTTIDQERGN